ncbi:hypothetical protein ACRZ5S_22495 (plasmid) [Vibrio scophthalmi]|uniref:hypothetical protein n=1 Tax=Vibrio scophthalmi TaxID=45658 RepID=UPI003EB9A0CD
MKHSHLLFSTLTIFLAGCSVFDEPQSCAGTLIVESPESIPDSELNLASVIRPNTFNQYSFEGDVVDEKNIAARGASKTVLMVMPSGDQTLYMIRGTTADYRRLDIQDSAFLAEPRKEVKLSVSDTGSTVVSEGENAFDYITVPSANVGFQGKVQWQSVSCHQRFTDFTLDSIIPVNNQPHAIGFYRQDREIGFITASLNDMSKCIVHRLAETGETDLLKNQSEYHYQSRGVAFVTVYGKQYQMKLDEQLIEALYD